MDWQKLPSPYPEIDVIGCYDRGNQFVICHNTLHKCFTASVKAAFGPMKESGVFETLDEAKRWCGENVH